MSERSELRTSRRDVRRRTSPPISAVESTATSDSPWDVVVVGGGPAGSATAARLAGLGHRVLLLDRAHFPRSKPCGECLNPAAVQALDALGVLPAVLRAGPTRLLGWRIAGSREAFDGSFTHDGHGLGLRRSVLDALLLKYARACGAKVRTGFRVTDLLHDRDVVRGVRVVGPDGRVEAVRARLTVGADGLRSVVVRRLDLLRRTPRLRKVALTAHVAGMAELHGRGRLHVGAGFCAGVAPVDAGLANITLVVPAPPPAGLTRDRADYFDRSLPALPGAEVAERTDAVLTTGPFDWPTRRASAAGALLVGDAAGYYDPFTGQGIFRALHGAELAAAAADRALRAGDVSARSFAGYEDARRRAFRSGRSLQHLIEGVVSRPKLLNTVAARLRRHPELADALVAVTGDVAAARSLLHPRLLLKALAPNGRSLAAHATSDAP